jgi:hypothetical protein
MLATLLGATPAYATPATINVTVSCSADTNFAANDGDNIVFTFASGCTSDSQLFTWKAWTTAADWLTPTSSGASVPSGTTLTKTLVQGNAYRNAGDYVAYVIPDINTASPSSSFKIIWQGALSATPTFLTQPADSSKTAGDSLSLSVSVSNGGLGILSYQWKKDGASLSGKTSATLSIPSVASGDAGSYTVEVTNTQDAQQGYFPVTVTSSAAVVTVAAAPSAPTPSNPSSSAPAVTTPAA